MELLIALARAWVEFSPLEFPFWSLGIFMFLGSLWWMGATAVGLLMAVENHEVEVHHVLIVGVALVFLTPVFFIFMFIPPGAAVLITGVSIPVLASMALAMAKEALFMALNGEWGKLFILGVAVPTVTLLPPVASLGVLVTIPLILVDATLITKSLSRSNKGPRSEFPLYVFMGAAGAVMTHSNLLELSFLSTLGSDHKSWGAIGVLATVTAVAAFHIHILFTLAFPVGALVAIITRR